MTNTARVAFDDLTFEDDRSVTYQGDLFTGIAYETNAAGVVVSEAEYENGVQQGVTREWDNTGRLLVESHFDRGSKHGISKSWHENGRLQSEAEYRYSIKIAGKLWDLSGRLIEAWVLPEDDPQRELLDLLSKKFER